MSRTTPLAPCGSRPRGGPALVLLALAAMMGPIASGAVAQAEDKPRLLVGQAPEKYVKADNVLLADVPNKDLSVLRLRPNSKGQFFLFISNPTKEDRTFQVRLVGAAGTVLQSLPAVPVSKGQTAPVPPPEPAPAAKPAAEEPAPKVPPAKETAAWLEGRGLPPQFRIRLVEVPKKVADKPLAEEVVRHEIQLGLLLPARYLQVTQPTYRAEDERLSVTIQGENSLVGEPCLVKMRLDLFDPAAGAVKEFVPADGVLQLPVTAGAANKVELFVKDPALKTLGKTRGLLTLSADGYERAFRYSVDFGATGGAEAVKPLIQSRVELKAPAVAVPGAPLPVRVGLDNLETLPGLPAAAGPLDDEVVLRLAFGRREKRGEEQTRFVAYSSKDLEGHRFQRILLNPRAADGAVAFRTEVHDWEVEVPTKGVFGTNEVRVEVLRKEAAQPVENSSGTPPAVYAPVTLDGVAPSIVSGRPDDDRLIAGQARPRLVRGQPIPVVARVKAPPSGLRSVAFVTDKLVPDPKLPGVLVIPEGATRVPGKHRAKEDKDGVEVWEAVLAEVPTDKKGKIEVVVEAVSNAGLKDLGRFEIVLVDAPPAAAGATLGSIKGKVLEGGRGQPGLLVVLKDGMGNLKADATTNDAGEYEFKDLPPGPYVVSAVKKKSSTKGEKPVQVKAGKDPATADVNLLR